MTTRAVLVATRLAKPYLVQERGFEKLAGDDRTCDPQERRVRKHHAALGDRLDLDTREADRDPCRYLRKADVYSGASRRSR
jgi:hypothetical protein